MISRSFAGNRQFRAVQKPAPPTIYPAGTLLSNVPALARGLTWMEYLDTCIPKWRAAGPEPAPPTPERRLRL